MSDDLRGFIEFLRSLRDGCADCGTFCIITEPFFRRREYRARVALPVAGVIAMPEDRELCLLVDGLLKMNPAGQSTDAMSFGAFFDEISALVAGHAMCGLVVADKVNASYDDVETLISQPGIEYVGAPIDPEEKDGFFLALHIPVGEIVVKSNRRLHALSLLVTPA